MNTFRTTIVTPSAAVFDEEVAYATFPAWDGQQGVMRGQSPLLSRLAVGSLRVDLLDGESRWYLVEGGFAQVHEDVLTILTERATLDTELSTEGVDELLADANARAVGPGGDLERRRAEDDQERARATRRMAAAAAARR